MDIKAGVHEKGTISFSDIIKGVKDRQDFHKAGGIAVFIGVVRGDTLKGEIVQKLELEAYQEKADKVLANICEEMRKKEGIVDVQIHHLLGEFGVGEDLVYVLVAGSHRRNLFPVLEEAVDRYKKETPIFKKEYVVNKKGESTSYWITEQKTR